MAAAPVIAYCARINSIINFVVVALAVFVLVKQMNRLVAKQDAAPAETPADVLLLTEIRDLLQQRST